MMKLIPAWNNIKNTAGKIWKFLHSKRGSRLTVLLLLILTVLTGITLHYALDDWRTDHVTRLVLRQDEDELVLTWNRIRSGKYRVDISDGVKKVLSEETDGSTYRYKGIEYQKEYKVTIYGKGEAGGYVRGATGTIYTRNPQTIKTAVDKAEGIKGDTVDIGAEADKELQYEIKDTAIASVDENGLVRLNKTGITTLKITAPESETELAEILSIPVVCYPEELKKPALSVHKKTAVSTVLRIRKVKYAETYELLRSAPGSDETDTIQVIDADDFGRENHLDIELAREIGTYRVRASAEAGDRKIESPESKAAEVASELDSAAAYSSITTVMEIHSEDVDRVLTASGSGSAAVAQSMCCTGDGYAVAFVNRGNSTGCLRKYSKTGEEMAANTDTGGLGHANGCTYDPGTGNIYVMKTYASATYHEIRAFSGETLEAVPDISFGTAPSGIGYDAPMKQFYMTASSRIYVTDKDLHMIRTIYRKRAYRSQDVAGYNGVVLSCIWTGGSGSYIDMYRALNGAYLGSIYAPFGEIESACVDDGHLVMLFNGGAVYRTKERVDFPG